MQVALIPPHRIVLFFNEPVASWVRINLLSKCVPIFPICYKLKVCPDADNGCDETYRQDLLHETERAMLGAYKQYLNKQADEDKG